jgi:hypothetical protein
MTEKTSWIQRVERRYAWNVIGFVMALVGIVLTVLSLREKSAAVAFTVVGEANVLDVHAPVPSLDVLYKGQSIQRRNLNLRVVTLRVENSGDIDILRNFYDERIPWGVRMLSGRVVETRVAGGNSEYLARTLSPQVATPDLVVFAPVILDRGKYALVEMLVLHAKTAEPRLVPTGKIAGVDRISVASDVPAERPGILRSSFGGGALVQVLRAAGYGALGIAVLVLGLWLSVGWNDRQVRATNRRHMREFDDAAAGLNLDDRTRRMARHAYLVSGVEGLNALLRLADDPSALAAALMTYREAEERFRHSVAKRDPKDEERFAHITVSLHRGDAHAAGELLTHKLTHNEPDGSVAVEPQVSAELRALIGRLHVEGDASHRI